MTSPKDLSTLVPCSATVYKFLYAQRHSILCSEHGSLVIERRFDGHKEDVKLLVADNTSDEGRLVVSYDASQTAIVWDSATGGDVMQFASFEEITAAAWVRDGKVAVGNTGGSITLVDPMTSDTIFSRTLEKETITALSSSADSKTFAIGYESGTVIVATLQPKFTVSHTLTTSTVPSPISALSWHISTRSAMLAVQARGGDLRVWNVPHTQGPDNHAAVIRTLNKAENSDVGPYWMAWSKNGCIVQYSGSETLLWDVKAKQVTWVSVPTLEYVRGLAFYRPGAALFTLGPNHTVQQFDLGSPPTMVVNVEHAEGLLPPPSMADAGPVALDGDISE
ncbi:WD domain-containing [Fusarium albosuccineum]|uniref:WD domain-containing n=1 Tax=Fusarium albosuccineum TaxID=1237068 RepID=A0A8H4L014_9HYPO|nr:WD domain-containing [Fusarium albosuccineum]